MIDEREVEKRAKPPMSESKVIRLGISGNLLLIDGLVTSWHYSSGKDIIKDIPYLCLADVLLGVWFGAELITEYLSRRKYYKSERYQEMKKQVRKLLEYEEKQSKRFH